MREEKIKEIAKEIAYRYRKALAIMSDDTEKMRKEIKRIREEGLK